MESKHTPGPTTLHVYETQEDDEGCVRLLVNTDEPHTPDGCDKMARLVDAAPDLLAAIKETVRRFDEYDATDALDAVNTVLRASIAKAEGK